MSVADAEYRIRLINLRPIVVRSANNTIQSNTIWKQQPEAGSQVDVDSQIVLTATANAQAMQSPLVNNNRNAQSGSSSTLNFNNLQNALQNSRVFQNLQPTSFQTTSFQPTNMNKQQSTKLQINTSRLFSMARKK